MRDKFFCTFGAVGLTVMLLSVSRPAVADVVNWKDLGVWSIDFYPSSEGCSASAFFDGGTTFYFGFDGTQGQLDIEIVLMNEKWNSIEAGKEYNIAASFGDESPWEFPMLGVEYTDAPGLRLFLDVGSDAAPILLEEFARELYMTWTFEGNLLGRYSLKGSTQALTETVACQKSYNEARRNMGGDPFDNGAASSDPFQ